MDKRSQTTDVFFIDHRLTQIGTDYEPKALIIIDDWLLIIDLICDNQNIFDI